eukprot:273774_1
MSRSLMNGLIWVLVIAVGASRFNLEAKAPYSLSLKQDQIVLYKISYGDYAPRQQISGESKRTITNMGKLLNDQEKRNVLVNGFIREKYIPGVIDDVAKIVSNYYLSWKCPCGQSNSYENPTKNLVDKCKKCGTTRSKWKCGKCNNENFNFQENCYFQKFSKAHMYRCNTSMPVEYQAFYKSVQRIDLMCENARWETLASLRSKMDKLMSNPSVISSYDKVLATMRQSVYQLQYIQICADVMHTLTYQFLDIIADGSQFLIDYVGRAYSMQRLDRPKCRNLYIEATEIMIKVQELQELQFDEQLAGEFLSFYSKFNDQQFLVRSSKRASEEHPKWPCSLCTYRNKVVDKKCEMCLTPKDDLYLIEGNDDFSNIDKMPIVSNPTQDSSPKIYGQAVQPSFGPIPRVPVNLPVPENDAQIQGPLVNIYDRLMIPPPLGLIHNMPANDRNDDNNHSRYVDLPASENHAQMQVDLPIPGNHGQMQGQFAEIYDMLMIPPPPGLNSNMTVDLPVPENHTQTEGQFAEIYDMLMIPPPPGLNSNMTVDLPVPENHTQTEGQFAEIYDMLMIPPPPGLITNMPVDLPVPENHAQMRGHVAEIYGMMMIPPAPGLISNIPANDRNDDSNYVDLPVPENHAQMQGTFSEIHDMLMIPPAPGLISNMSANDRNDENKYDFFSYFDDVDIAISEGEFNDDN